MFNKLNILQTILFCLITSIFASIYAYMNTDIFIKLQENKLATFEKIQLYMIRVIHYSIAFFSRLYPVLTEIAIVNDLYFLLFCFIIVIHWFIFSECVLSIKEKQILDNTYVAGSNVTYQPFYNLLQKSQIFLNILKYLSYVAVFIVIIRVLFYNY